MRFQLFARDTRSPWHLECLDRSHCDKELESGVATLQYRKYREEWPLSSGPSVEAFHRRLAVQKSPRRLWVALDGPGRTVIGHAQYRESHGYGRIDLFVSPENRRRGIGRELIVRILQEGKIRERTTVAGRAHIPGAEPWAHRLNADRAGILRHVEKPAGNARRSQVNSIHLKIAIYADGQFPDALVDQLARLKLEVRQRFEPLRPLSLTESRQLLHSRMVGLRCAGVRTWTLGAFNRRGDLVGFSEYIFDPEEPDLLLHSSMAVQPAERGLGVAEQLVSSRRLLLDEVPSVERVRYTKRYRYDLVGAPGGPQRQADGSWEYYERRWYVDSEALRQYAR